MSVKSADLADDKAPSEGAGAALPTGPPEDGKPPEEIELAEKKPEKKQIELDEDGNIIEDEEEEEEGDEEDEEGSSTARRRKMTPLERDRMRVGQPLHDEKLIDAKTRERIDTEREIDETRTFPAISMNLLVRFSIFVGHAPRREFFPRV